MRPKDTQSSPATQTFDEYVDTASQMAAVTPSYDYSLAASQKRDTARAVDYGEALRRLSRRYERIATKQTLDNAETPPWEDPMFDPNKKPDDQAANQSQSMRLAARDINYLIAKNSARNAPIDLAKFPDVQQMITQASASGLDMSVADIDNLVDYSVVNDAADTIIAGMKTGDPNVYDTVVGTMLNQRGLTIKQQQQRIVMASIVPGLIDQKLRDVAQSPEWINSAVNAATTGLGVAVKAYVDSITDPMRKGFLVGSNSIAGGGTELRGTFGPVLGVATGLLSVLGVKLGDQQQYEQGSLNNDYINILREQKNPDGTARWSPLAVDLITQIYRANVTGDPQPVTSVWQQYKGNPEASKIIGELLAPANESTKQTDIQTLYNQVSAADMSRWTYNPLDVRKYHDVYGEGWYRTAMDVTGLGLSVALDPLVLGSKAMRTVQAARWALFKLAPDATTTAVEVLRPAMTVGKMVVHTPASRAAQRFVRDMNRIDGLGKAAAAAESAGNVAKATRLRAQESKAVKYVGQQYDSMPEQLITDLRNGMPRGKDGKYTVDGLARWIDSTNDAFRMMAGDVAPRLANAGLVDATKRAALLRVLQDAAHSPGGGAEGKAMREAAGKRLEEVKSLDQQARELEAMQGRLFVSQVSKVSKDRDLLIPRMSAAKRVRTDFLNGVRVSVMPSSRVDTLLNKYLGRYSDPNDFAADFNANAFEIGDAVRDYRHTAFLDGIGRSFASLPDVVVLETANASNTVAFGRLARAFLPRRMTRILEEQWRKGTPGTRRNLVIGVVRTAARVRGYDLSIDDATKFINGEMPDLVAKTTGISPREQYGIMVRGSELPSVKAGRVAQQKKAAQQAASEARKRGEPVPAVDIVDNAAPSDMPGYSLSADESGLEHALHRRQLATRVHVPNIRMFEDLRAQEDLARRVYYRLGVGAGIFTDLWSTATLAAPRTALRNAIEENLFFLFGSGKVKNLLKGRAADQAIRRAGPRIANVTDGNKVEPRIVGSNLGIVASTMQKFGNKLRESGAPDWLADFIYTGVNKDAQEQAAVRFANGDTSAFRDLVVSASVGHKLGPKAISLLNEDNTKILGYLADSTHGMALYNEVMGSSKYLSSGVMPDLALDAQTIDIGGPGIEWGALRAPETLDAAPDVAGEIRAWASVAAKRAERSPSRYRVTGFGNLAPKQKEAGQSGNAIFGVTAWYNNLQMTIAEDGPIGQAALRLLNNPRAAKAEIARIIRQDTEYGYKADFSRITDDVSIDRFASSYFEDVFHHFTRQDGTLNTKLWKRFMYEGEDGQRFASWTNPATGELSVSMADMLALPRKQRPSEVFGPKLEPRPMIPLPNEEGLSGRFGTDKVFAALGRANSRMSKGPIFLGNVISRWEESAPARASLAQSLAKSAGRDVANADDIKLAEQLYAKTTIDSAYNLTMSFVDNPANRSNLAWKIRNYSRYYRATEDFWRRSWRLAKTRPEAFLKLGLVINALNDTGFVQSDEQGNTYFVYPGSDYAMELLSSVTGKIFGTPTVPSPYLLGGKLTGLTPSSDPFQQLPTASGPAAMLLTSVFDTFPALKGMRGVQMLTLGKYANVTGNVWSDVANAMIPVTVQRALEAFEPQQRDASIAQGAFDTLALMSANGMLDEVTIDGRKVPLQELQSPEEFKASREYEAANKMAVGWNIARWVAALTAPAAPQLYDNNVSDIGRELGISGQNPLWRTLLNQYKDSPNAWELALADFQLTQAGRVINGEEVPLTDFLPYTISSYKSNQSGPDMGLNSLSRVRLATKQLFDWWNTDGTQDLVNKNFKTGALFLAPRTGEFSWPAFSLIRDDLGLIVKKDENDLIMDLLSSTGSYKASRVRTYYDAQIAALDPNDPLYKNKVKDLEWAKSEETKSIKALYPAYAFVSQYAPRQEQYKYALTNTREMLDYMRKRDGKLTGAAAAIDEAIKAFLDYEYQKTTFTTGSRASISEAKASADADLAARFATLKEKDPNAKFFIEAVLEPINYTDYADTVRIAGNN